MRTLACICAAAFVRVHVEGAVKEEVEGFKWPWSKSRATSEPPVAEQLKREPRIHGFAPKDLQKFPELAIAWHAVQAAWGAFPPGAKLGQLLQMSAEDPPLHIAFAAGDDAEGETSLRVGAYPRRGPDFTETIGPATRPELRDAPLTIWINIEPEGRSLATLFRKGHKGAAELAVTLVHELAIHATRLVPLLREVRRGGTRFPNRNLAPLYDAGAFDPELHHKSIRLERADDPYFQEYQDLAEMARAELAVAVGDAVVADFRKELKKELWNQKALNVLKVLHLD